MDLSKLFTESVNVLKLSKGAMAQAAEAPFKNGLLVMAIMAFLAAMGFVFFPSQPFEGVTYRPDLFWFLGRFIWNFLYFFLSFALIGLVAELALKSKVNAREFVSLMGHASLAGFLLLVPLLFPAVALWWIFIMHEAFTKLGKLGTGSVVFLICIQFLFSVLIGYHYFPFSG